MAGERGAAWGLYFIDALPAGHRYAFEFRNPTWNDDAVLEVLRSRGAAYCIFHLAGYRSPPTITADFIYIRLHGPGGKYQGSYTDEVLGSWADRIRQWRAGRKTVYIYFDYDNSGYAPQNALRLKTLPGVPEKTGLTPLRNQPYA